MVSRILRTTFAAVMLLAALLLIPIFSGSGKNEFSEPGKNEFSGSGKNEFSEASELACVESITEYISLMSTERYNVGCDGGDIVISDESGNELHRIAGGIYSLPETERAIVRSGFTVEAEKLEKLLEAYSS